MNVSMAEFQCVCLNYSQNQRLLFQDEVAKAYLEKNILTLKHYLVKCNQQEKVAKTDVQFLVDYLFSVDERGVMKVVTIMPLIQLKQLMV